MEITRLIDVRCYITCIFYAENKSLRRKIVILLACTNIGRGLL